MFKSSLCVFAFSAVTAVAYDPTRQDNLVVYWGQNSYGVANPNNTPTGNKRL
ncbi:hypothetical protein DFH08DRAFT_969373 [Mycena albidolilacea]|uniref:Chitinase n=1 Tax=Mycena albidolilacea TaxID=1033008 RepID=A0AAD6ZHJ3_9AGAR|nr:hypothetical protein DFH08DRAFT_969373 [Mycena albidolilacea]